jgi:hypothetical protein
MFIDWEKLKNDGTSETISKELEDIRDNTIYPDKDRLFAHALLMILSWQRGG